MTELTDKQRMFLERVMRDRFMTSTFTPQGSQIIFDVLRSGKYYDSEEHFLNHVRRLYISKYGKR